MIQDIKTINIWSKNFLLKDVGGVNSYLVKTDKEYILIDAGLRYNRLDFIQ